MANKTFDRTLSGGAIAFCIVLFCSLSINGQPFTPSKKFFTISGSVGQSGVVMSNLPDNVVTNENGYYSASVEYGWSGRVKPIKKGYTFTPSETPYNSVKSNFENQNYTFEVMKFTISGSVGQPGVIMNGLPGSPVSGSDGTYKGIVDYGWNGTVEPQLAGYTFTPLSKPYTQVDREYAGENYQAAQITFAISGSVGEEGVVMSGLPGNPISGADGTYKAVVGFDWSGTVTPDLIGYTFTPDRQTYTRVNSNVTQNYTAAPITFTISGSVGVIGVEIKGLPNRVVTDQSGNYNTQVIYGWTGTLVPEKEGYVFNPPNRTYPPLISAEVGQDYTWTLQKKIISGKIMSAQNPVEGVTVFADSGGGSTITNANGEYELSIDFGWSGSITPEKQGMTFKPEKIPYPRVNRDQTNQSYAAEMVMFTLSGAMSMGGVPLEGVLMSASEGGVSSTTDAKGRYSVKVPYGWSGDISPKKEGYDFNPPGRSYVNVTTNYEDGSPVRREPAPQPALPTSPSTQQVPPTTAPPVTGVREPAGLTDRGPVLDLAPGQEQFEQQKALVEGQLGTLQQQVDDLLRQLSAETVTGPNVPKVQIGQSPPAEFVPPRVIEKAPSVTIAVPTRALKMRGGPLVSIVCIETNLREVMQELEAQSGVKIYVDDTVKGKVTCKIVNLPLEQALEEVLKGTGLAFKEVPNSYLIYKPISNTFIDTEIREVLLSIATMAGVVIIPDETVAGTVTADIKGVPLDTALDIVLAGSSYVVKKTPYYYLVASSKVDAPAFPMVSETRRVKLNYIAANIAAQLLSPAFRPYIQGDITTNTILITAPASLLNRIISDIKEADQAPRHVMLDARIVVMEKSNLLNLGVDWGWPKMRAGFFGSDFFGGGAADLQFDGDWPWGVQIGYTPDAMFTDSLVMTLNLLSQNGEANIVSSPQVLAQDGRPAQINVMNEEYYYLTAPQRGTVGYGYTEAQLQTIEAGTRLEITPRIGDNNDITMDIITEVSDVVSRGEQDQQILPLVTLTRRRSTNTVRVRDGGTVAIAGLTENKTIKSNRKVPGIGDVPIIGNMFKSKTNQQASREIAVFITARLVPEMQELVEFAEPAMGQMPTAPVGEEEFKTKLRQSMIRTNR